MREAYGKSKSRREGLTGERGPSALEMTVQKSAGGELRGDESKNPDIKDDWFERYAHKKVSIECTTDGKEGWTRQ